MRKRGWMNIKNSKDRGAWAELCFAARAMEEALRPARPTGEPSGYDFLVHHKSTRIFRIQVKSTIYKQYRCYHCTIRTQNRIYKKDSFDFVAAYVIPEDVWYILPEKVVRGMSTVGLCPAMAGAKYDAYKEAWHLLRGESPGVIKSIQACAEECSPEESPLFARNARNGAPWRFVKLLFGLVCWRGGRRGGSRLQGPAAVGAELVAEVDAALAVWAHRAQAGAAAGTVAEARLDLGVALRTVRDARLAQDKIEDDPEAVGDEDGNEGPKQAAHAAAAGVLVDVADEDGPAAEHCSHEESQQTAGDKRKRMAIRGLEDHKGHGNSHEDRCV
jgi:PD-(D/E)XK endonuclease